VTYNRNTTGWLKILAERKYQRERAWGVECDADRKRCLAIQTARIQSHPEYREGEDGE